MEFIRGRRLNCWNTNGDMVSQQGQLVVVQLRYIVAQEAV